MLTVISQGEHMTHLVAELALIGLLSGGLCKLEEDGTLATNDVLLECGMQVCDGMAHPAEMGIRHRELALLDVLCFSFDHESRYKVRAKITDFGMAKEGGYAGLTTSSVGGGLPIRWMSPETFHRHSWSAKSDVWAFGVTMSVLPPCSPNPFPPQLSRSELLLMMGFAHLIWWENFTYIMIPYALILSDQEVAQAIVSGHHLEPPAGCTASIFAVMQASREDSCLSGHFIVVPIAAFSPG